MIDEKVGNILEALTKELHKISDAVIRLETRFEGVLTEIGKVEDLKKRVIALEIEIAVLKTKIILAGTAVSIFISVLINYILKQI